MNDGTERRSLRRYAVTTATAVLLAMSAIDVFVYYNELPLVSQRALGFTAGFAGVVLGLSVILFVCRTSGRTHFRVLLTSIPGALTFGGAALAAWAAGLLWLAGLCAAISLILNIAGVANLARRHEE